MAETTVFLARICERRQYYDKVDNWLDESQRELSTLYPNGVPPIPVTNTTADIGHSLVIPSEHQVPAAFFQAAVHHFRGKNQIQRGVIEGSEETIPKVLETWKRRSQLILKSRPTVASSGIYFGRLKGAHGFLAIAVAAGLALTTRRRLIVLPCSSVKLVRVPDTIISFRRFWMTGTGGQKI